MRFIIFLLILIASSLQFQTTNDNIKPGVYKWKSNFLSNYPSYQLNFKIEKGRNRSLGVFKGKSNIPHYIIKFDSKEEKLKYKNVAGIFGFSDGENFYLPSEFCENCDFQNKMYFKANFIGEKYLYYDFFSPRVDRVAFDSNSNLRGFDGGEGTMVISLKKREKFILSKKNIKEQLKNHHELYEQFKREKNKNLVLKKYLKLLDKKN